MPVYVYYRETQESILKQLKEQLSDVIVFKKTSYLKETLFEKIPNFLLIISQPSVNECKELNSIKWERVLILEGIRFQEMPCRVVSQIYDVRKILDEETKNFVSMSKKKYFKALIHEKTLTQEESHYLCDYIGDASIQKGKRWWSDYKNRRKKKVYQNQIIGVFGNAQWAACLAKVLSKNSDQRILIVDGNLLKPTLDVYFGIKHIETHIESHLQGIDNTGLNIALDGVHKKTCFEWGIRHMVCKKSKNLHVMLGNYNVYNYEHYHKDTFKELLLTLKKAYDLVLVCCTDNVYDAFTLTALHTCDKNVMIADNSIPSVRYCKNMMDLLCDKQRISKNRFFLATVKGLQNSHALSENALRELFKQQYLGHSHFNKIIHMLLERRT